MNISAGFIKRPVATAMLMVGLLLLGLAAYPLMPVAALPNVNYPTITGHARNCRAPIPRPWPPPSPRRWRSSSGRFPASLR